MASVIPCSLHGAFVLGPSLVRELNSMVNKQPPITYWRPAHDKPDLITKNRKQMPCTSR